MSDSAVAKFKKVIPLVLNSLPFHNITENLYIKIQMTNNFLLLNSDKTKVIVIGLQHLRNTLSNDILTLDGFALASRTIARNLGVVFNQDMSFNSQINKLQGRLFSLT